METRLFLAENRPLLVAGVRALLAASDEFAIVGERGRGPISREQVLQARPDVVLVGAAIDGAELPALAVPRIAPAPWRLVVLGSSPVTAQVHALRDAGVCACLSLDMTAQEMHRALMRVADRGHRAHSLLHTHCALEGDCPVTDNPTAAFGLTQREREILGLLAAGQTTSTIAESLALAPSTVSTFIRRIKTRLALSTNHELVSFAVVAGLAGPHG